ncbi:MAG: RES family NAD+ phosphorylase [Terriglobales bacterium]
MIRAFRIADRRFPIFDGAGARLLGGRWSSPGRAVIYASETFAGAVLEVLVHANLGRLPKTHALVEIAIPDSIGVEVVAAAMVPRWDGPDALASRSFGDRWLLQQRTAVLLVPSAVTGGRERNLLLNPAHPEFARIQASQPQIVAWDERLLRRA